MRLPEKKTIYRVRDYIMMQWFARAKGGIFFIYAGRWARRMNKQLQQHQQ